MILRDGLKNTLLKIPLWSKTPLNKSRRSVDRPVNVSASGRERLWDIQSHLAAEQTKRPHLPVLPGCATNRPLDPIKVKRKITSIVFYEAFFYRLLNGCNQRPSRHKFRFKSPLYSLYAPAIDLSLKRFPSGPHINQ